MNDDVIGRWVNAKHAGDEIAMRAAGDALVDALQDAQTSMAMLQHVTSRLAEDVCTAEEQRDDARRLAEELRNYMYRDAILDWHRELAAGRGEHTVLKLRLPWEPGATGQ